jgi:hypothetical protein
VNAFFVLFYFVWSEPGEMLVPEGSPGEGLYFLYKGEVE